MITICYKAHYGFYMNQNIKINSSTFYIRSVSILLIAVCIGVFAKQQVVLEFRDSAVVNDAKVLMKDIANLENVDVDSLRALLGEMVVGDAAPAGYCRFINSIDVIQYSLSHTIPAVTFIQDGTKRIKIRTDAKIRTVGDYEQQIAEYLSDNIAWGKDAYTFSIENKTREWFCYKKPGTVEVTGLSSPYPKGNQSIKLIITQDSVRFSIPVVLRIKVSVPVVCVNEPIVRDKIITRQNVELMTMDITSFRYTPYMDPASVIGKIAIRAFSRGTIIYRGCIKEVPDISKGDNVMIVVKKGPIQISVPARAREEGIKGDRIMVENLKTLKLVRVVIAEKGIVHLTEGESI